MVKTSDTYYERLRRKQARVPRDVKATPSSEEITLQAAAREAQSRNAAKAFGNKMALKEKRLASDVTLAEAGMEQKEALAEKNIASKTRMTERRLAESGRQFDESISGKKTDLATAASQNRTATAISVGNLALTGAGMAANVKATNEAAKNTQELIKEIRSIGTLKSQVYTGLLDLIKKQALTFDLAIP